MPKIRYLKIRFDNFLKPYEVPAFRSAVIEATERQSVLFHNHLPTKGFNYKYPLIQYKITERKATIICLNSGADDIHYLLQNRELALRIGNRLENYQIEDVQLHYHQVQIWQADFHYALRHWMGLNQHNYREFIKLESEVERLQFLERVLQANLLSFATGIGWYSEDRLEVRITKFKSEKWLPFKGRKVLCFTLNFATNVSLPDFVGLGKGVSSGFGSVKQFGSRKPQTGSKGRTLEPAENKKDRRRQPHPIQGRPEAEEQTEKPAEARYENESNHTL